MKKVYYLFLLLSCINLVGCDLAKNHSKIDREGDLEVQDYRDLFSPRDVDTEEASDLNNIPPLMPYVAGLSDNLKPMPLVSVNLNQSVPLRDALFELAKEAEYDLELDPGIRGSIIFTARNKPFDVVIKRISDVAGLRYKFEEETLRIEVDNPYSEAYKIDFLNVVRNSNSTISNDISVVSGEGTDTGSSFSTDTTSESNFWAELEGNVSQILNVSGSHDSLRTSRDPRLNVTDPRPVPVEQAGASGNGGEENLNANTGGQQQEQNPPQAVLQVDSLPLDEVEESSGGSDEEGGPSFSINRQAGIILVYATQKQHEEVASYLALVKKTLTSQVLIEAKILEVTLSDEFSTGIAWNDIDLLGDGFLSFTSGTIDDGGFISGVRPVLNPAVAPPTNFSVGFAGNDALAVVEAVSRFGTVKALASPRLTVLNNQPAILNVATNVVYFDIEIDRTDGTDSNPPTLEVESDVESVPEGVLINVIPSIDLDSRSISMALRPTVTTIESFVDDPSVAFVAGDTGLTNAVPQVNIQEIDSVINMHSGEAIVMGGLMQDRVESTQAGVPGLSEIPLAGSLFRNQGDQITKTELVIFLKATILDGGNSTIHNTDRDFYKKFSGDRRPFKL